MIRPREEMPELMPQRSSTRQQGPVLALMTRDLEGLSRPDRAQLDREVSSEEKSNWEEWEAIQDKEGICEAERAKVKICQAVWVGTWLRRPRRCLTLSRM